jgi:hypothetical protein
MNNEELIDLFAGLAMQGILARENPHNLKIFVKNAYLIAEEMIKEKERRNERTQD